MRALVPVRAVACTPEMSGLVQSARAVTTRDTFVCPWPSLASMYVTVIVSPSASESRPSLEGGFDVVVIDPVYCDDPGADRVSVTACGAGSVVEDTVTVVVAAPMFPSLTVIWMDAE